MQVGDRAHRRAATALVALTAALLTACVAGAQAHAAPVVITPKQGEKVTEHPVEIVVRAGPEAADLRANLNRKPVGSHFKREPGGTRVLDASNSHGLRHGTNVLEVRVRNGRASVRRETVRFEVAHRRPLIGADVDHRVPAGTRFELAGDVVHHPRGPRSRGVKWSVVKVPGEGRLGPPIAAARRQAAATAIGGADTLTPTFKPDAPGAYVLKETATTKRATVTDRVAVQATPGTHQLLNVDTSVGVGGGQFAIAMGEQLYRAPPMHSVGGADSWVGSSPTWDHYAALWQVVVLDRTNLGFIENKTYGFCNGPRGEGICERGDNGEPFLVLAAGGQPEGSAGALAAQLEAFGQEGLVVATNHYDGDSAWGSPNTWNAATGGFSGVGFPSHEPQGIEGASGASVIGVPGMKAGDADYVVNPGTAHLVGYLTPDPHNHYAFIPSTRATFDTRLSPECGATAGACTVTHRVGENTEKGTIDDGEGGYFVSAYDAHSLAFKDSRVYTTAGTGAGDQLNADLLAQVLREHRVAGDVVVVSSIETPTQPTKVTYSSAITQATWRDITAQIALLGGTKHRFSTGASTPNSDYTLVGWGGAQEGDAEEAIGAGARLRGALVPNNASLFRTANTSSTGEPAERLNQLLIKPPSDAWALSGDSDAGARKAFSDLGKKVQMTSNPRVAYTKSLHDADEAIRKVDLVQLARKPAGSAYTQADFDAAKDVLETELLQVANVRDYMATLAAPTVTTNDDTWEEVQTVSDRLQADLKVAKQDAAVGFEPFSFIEALLDFGGAFVGDEDLGKQISAIAASAETAAVLWDADYDGSSAVDDDPKVQADELADALKEQARNAITSYQRMGDVIVSDPVKLAEVGTYGGCTLPCDDGYGEYSTDDAETATALVRRALHRTIYERLVPVSYPIYDTGLTRDPTPRYYDCDAGGEPFDVETDGNGIYITKAPDLAYTQLLDDFDPAGANTRVRPMVSVHNESTSWSWADPKILHRMFDPVQPSNDADAGGLGIDPRDWMREKYNAGGATQYVITADGCGWDDPGSD